jgi:hypothetical protein
VWLETVLAIEAAAAFWLSSLNVALLLRVVAATAGRARRMAALVLTCVCGGHAMEAVVFLALAEPGSEGWSGAAVLLVRTALLASAALIALLLLRASMSPR